MSTVLYAGVWDERTRTRQTERLVLVMEQNKSFLGPGEIDKTSSGVTFGSVGTVDSCLAANTGKYICHLTAPGARRKRNDRNPATRPIKERFVTSTRLVNVKIECITSKSLRD